jgi:hypothetical protein
MRMAVIEAEVLDVCRWLYRHFASENLGAIG